MPLKAAGPCTYGKFHFVNSKNLSNLVKIFQKKLTFDIFYCIEIPPSKYVYVKMRYETFAPSAISFVVEREEHVLPRGPG